MEIGDFYVFWVEGRVIRIVMCWGDGVSSWLKFVDFGFLELLGDIDN